jgi:hypothetical protein
MGLGRQASCAVALRETLTDAHAFFVFLSRASGLRQLGRADGGGAGAAVRAVCGGEPGAAAVCGAGALGRAGAAAAPAGRRRRWRRQRRTAAAAAACARRGGRQPRRSSSSSSSSRRGRRRGVCHTTAVAAASVLRHFSAGVLTGMHSFSLMCRTPAGFLHCVQRRGRHGRAARAAAHAERRWSGRCSGRGVTPAHAVAAAGLLRWGNGVAGLATQRVGEADIRPRNGIAWRSVALPLQSRRRRAEGVGVVGKMCEGRELYDYHKARAGAPAATARRTAGSGTDGSKR